MKTAILVFILIVIAIAIYCFGFIIGGLVTGKRLAGTIEKALEDSELTSEQKLDLLDKIQKEAKK